MPFSDKQQEFFRNANHRWNIKVGATRSGKTYMDYYVIPKRIRARAEKEGLVAILGVSKGTMFTAWALRKSARYLKSEALH